MNSIKIEKLSINHLKLLIAKHQLMNDFINDNDKEPSWDGSIYTYSKSSLKVEEIQYKVSVQVKGKNNEKLLKKQSIQYPVEYRHMRNYFNDGGVFYFVIVVSDDGEKYSIFYNAICLSENLAIDVKAGKLDFKAIADLESNENDVKFIKTMRSGKAILMEGQPLVTYADFSFKDGLDESLSNFEKTFLNLLT